MMTGTSGRNALTLGSISSPVMPGMLMSDRIRISDCSIVAGNARQRVRRRIGKIHHKALRAQSRRNCWRNKRLDIGFVIDHKNQNAHV